MAPTRMPHRDSFVQEQNMVRILIFIVLLFIVCQSVKLIIDVYEAVNCSKADRWGGCDAFCNYVIMSVNNR